MIFLGVFYLLHTNRQALSSSCLHFNWVFSVGYSYFWRFDFEDNVFKAAQSWRDCGASSFCFYDADGCTMNYGWCLWEKTGQFCFSFVCFCFFCSRDSRVWKNKWKLRSLLTRRAVSFLVYFFLSCFFSLYSFSSFQHELISVFGYCQYFSDQHSLFWNHFWGR